MPRNTPDHYGWFKHVNPDDKDWQMDPSRGTKYLDENKWPNLEAYDKEQVTIQKTTEAQEVHPDAELGSPRENMSEELETDATNSTQESEVGTPEFWEKAEETRKQIDTKAETLSPEEIQRRMGIPLEGRGPAAEVSEETAPTEAAASLSAENRNLLDHLPPIKRSMAERIFSGLKNIPGAQLVVGKMELAYSKFLADRYEQKHIDLQRTVADLEHHEDGLVGHINTLNAEQQHAEDIIAKFQQEGISGTDSLRARIIDIEKQKSSVIAEANKIEKAKFAAQQSLGSVEDQMKLYTDRKEIVADGLIEQYNRELESLEAPLADLQINQDHLDLLDVAQDGKHAEYKKRIDVLKNRIDQIKIDLIGTNMSAKEIKKFPGILEAEQELSELRMKIDKEKSEMSRHKLALKEKVVAVRGQARVYQGKRDEFQRIKDNRPIDTDIKIETDKTGEVKETVAVRTKKVVTTSQGRVSGGGEGKTEYSIEIDKRLNVDNVIDSLNNFLQKTLGIQDEKTGFIKKEQFLQLTGLSKSFKLDSDKLSKIVKSYYKLKRVSLAPENIQKIDDFFRK